MSEWIRHRGSKSMPKCLEGKRFEARLRDGVVHESEFISCWNHQNQPDDVMAYRVLGDITPPDYSKGFPVGTTAKDIGAKVGDEFVVVDSIGGFENGTIIKLERDDLSECPFFADGEVEHCMFWYELAPIPPKTAIEMQAEEVGIPEPVQLVDDDVHLGIKRPDGDGWVKYNAGDVVDLDVVISIDWVNALGTESTTSSPRDLMWNDGDEYQIAWYRLNYGDTSQHYTSEQQATEADKCIDDAAQSVRESLGIAPPTNKYQRTIKGVTVDVYDVLAAFGVTCQARGHAIKKLLMAGQRGNKDEALDLREAVQAIERSIELVSK